MGESIKGLRNYLTVTLGYWAFTLTDGAIRMLVILYFHQLGYSPLEIAMLFLFYEFFGVVTNLVGGWIGARVGLNLTMHTGMGLQVGALSMLAVPEGWLTVPYVMAAQALSGIAKDLNKMSAKASVKLMLPDTSDNSEESRLFRWVSALTGSKNALKGAGFFIGAVLLSLVGFRTSLLLLAGMLLLVLFVTVSLLPSDIGVSGSKPRISQIFSKTAEINWLSAARFFLFGSRDIWFVVALPIFLSSIFGWNHMEVGGFLALWIIGYGTVQAIAPLLLRRSHKIPSGRTASISALLLATIPAGLALMLNSEISPQIVTIVGLLVFGVVFAINSAIHSFLILALSDHDRVAMNVGFYYMSNAGGRLVGTVLSGLIYQQQGIEGCLWWSAFMLLVSAVFAYKVWTKQQNVDYPRGVED